MTGGRAFTFFLIVAIFIPLALNIVIAFGERQTPAIHRWYLRHARGINWTLAVIFSILTTVAFFRPGSTDSEDPFFHAMGPTGARWFMIAILVGSAFDHAWRAVRAGRQVEQ